MKIIKLTIVYFRIKATFSYLDMSFKLAKNNAIKIEVLRIQIVNIAHGSINNIFINMDINIINLIFKIKYISIY